MSPLPLRRLLPAFAVLLLLSFALPTFAQDQPTHTVQPGENLFRIALNYGLTTEQLAAANNIANAWQIYSGQVLVIPAAGQPAAPAADPALDPNLPALEPASAATTTYTVQRGDNLASIARRFGMSVEQVASLNNLANPNLLFAGQVLTVNGVAEPAPAPAPVVDPAPAPPPAAPTTQTIHVVQPGEYLSAIARRYGVSYLAIAQANNIFDANTVFSGQRLIIPAPGTVPDAAVQAVPAAPAPIVGVGREIVVDLSDSRAYAYENGVLLRNVLGSMGRSVTPTVVGSFSIQRKYVSSPMTGPGYYLPDVPYAMYFYQGYAIHGTYWHSNWGVPMSHGCVNLPTPEAEWFFSFADIGTPVNVQY